MLNIFNAKQAKQAARSLERFLAAKGHDIKLGVALEALGQMSGNKNWAALASGLTEETVNRELSQVEQDHLLNAGDADIRSDETGAGGYGEESALIVHTGFQLRYPAYREGRELLDYVRVCDPLGREIGYWISDEWSEDPELVMGAIFGALGRGRTIEFDNKKNVTADSSVAQAAKCMFQPSICDVPWDSVTAVLINEEHFYLRTVENDQPALLSTSPAQGDDECLQGPDINISLGIGWDDDGIIREQCVSAETLRSLKWDAAIKVFVDPVTLHHYKFILAVQFGL